MGSFWVSLKVPLRVPIEQSMSWPCRRHRSLVGAGSMQGVSTPEGHGALGHHLSGLGFRGLGV